MTTQLAHRVAASLAPDPGRVLARLFLPGEEPYRGESHVAAVLARLLALSEQEVVAAVSGVIAEFGDRHPGLPDLLLAHAVAAGLDTSAVVSRERALLVGAGFTAEFALEGAALCNPSAFPHPDQSGLAPGQLRVAVSLRAIGEGHVSSLAFAEAIVGPGATWEFVPRDGLPVAASTAPAAWRREHLREVLEVDGSPAERVVNEILGRLPESFTAREFDAVLLATSPQLLQHEGGVGTVNRLRTLVASAYDASVPSDVPLSRRVLAPAASAERNGIEDARFVQLLDDEGAPVEYRATYTAYDGTDISPRLLRTSDLQTFHVERLAGAGIRNKGIALFPRRVNGRHLALLRSDGESTWLAASEDGRAWQEPRLVTRPAAAWEAVAVGNCGSPLETSSGWLVLTHGVAPMRTYAIGALLLDLDDPARVIGRLPEPLLRPAPGRRSGYVPNVVYSCGGIVHDGRVWIPFGENDTCVSVAWASVDEVIGAMVPPTSQE